MQSEDYVVHMRRVQTAQRDLSDLGLIWQMIEASAAISCPTEAANILPTLSVTRDRFDRLQAELIERMIRENLAELNDELSARAQCAIDILVRNLFERTADVGFLAFDPVVRGFCSAAPDRQAELHAFMVQRLEDYRKKYTVYEDIVLTDVAGNVTARLNADAPGSAGQEALIQSALAHDGFVERFGTSDLFASDAACLLYAHRVEDRQGQPVGVLVLQFRFADEMQRIFERLADDRHQLALVLTDAQGQVIATNDRTHVPPGAQLMAVPEHQVALTVFAGREYLAVSCPSPGYQGYAGPGWRAQAMVSLLTGFRQHAPSGSTDEDIPVDNGELDAMGREADAINRDLRRVVWNGRLASQERATGASAADASARLNAVLTQVNQAGQRTRNRVGQAIKDLYRTSLFRARQQSASLALLAADVMDRNLYERANDCRWWAQSPAFQKALAAEAGEHDPAALNQVLDHINQLYTVYSRLVVFDRAGMVRGVSRSSERPGLEGSPVPAHWLQAVRALTDSESYCVSDFQPCELHDRGDTYVYMAAVRGGRDGTDFLGGVAVIFDSATEFRAMLGNVMGDRAGVAAFLDEDGVVIATSSDDFSHDDIRLLAGGPTMLELRGVYYACARVAAKGYREFKVSDGYDNRVSAVVALRLGVAERRGQDLSESQMSTQAVGDPTQRMELAIFQVGPNLYGLAAEHLYEAASKKGLIRLRHEQSDMLGMLEVTSLQPAQLVPVRCARRHFRLQYPARETDGVVIVLRSSAPPHLPVLGLMVDDVVTVITTDRRALQPVPPNFSSSETWVSGLLDAEVVRNNGKMRAMVQILDPEKIRG